MPEGFCGTRQESLPAQPSRCSDKRGWGSGTGWLVWNVKMSAQVSGVVWNAAAYSRMRNEKRVVRSYRKGKSRSVLLCSSECITKRSVWQKTIHAQLGGADDYLSCNYHRCFRRWFLRAELNVVSVGRSLPSASIKYVCQKAFVVYNILAVHLYSVPRYHLPRCFL